MPHERDHAVSDERHPRDALEVQDNPRRNFLETYLLAAVGPPAGGAGGAWGNPSAPI
jgi:hypothetical protein